MQKSTGVLGLELPCQEDLKQWVIFFRELNTQNFAVSMSISTFRDELGLLRSRVNQLQRSLDQGVSQASRVVKKKNRRTASQVEKTSRCPHESCGKWYGSEVSLNLHLKLKHGGAGRRSRKQSDENRSSNDLNISTSKQSNR